MDDHARMSRTYLKQMEEKIFHVKPNPCDAAKEDRDLEIYEKSPELRRKPSLVYSSSNGYIPKQFPRELLRQLSQHERFERQHMKCSGRAPKIVNVGRPDFSVKKSGVQMSCGEPNAASPTKRSSSVPPQKRPTRRKNPRSVELFNPSYSFESGGESLGRSLLESIRTKVFGFRGSDRKVDNEEEWRSDAVLSNSDSMMRFPKETRHAMTNLFYDRQARLCVSCSRQIRKVEMSDAQTSPVTSKTLIQQARRKSQSVIPCPVNLLCERGIHVGRCDEGAKGRSDSPVCRVDCQCKKVSYSTEPIRRHPGKAQQQTSHVTIPAASEETGREETVEQSESQVSIALEAKSSMETILQLLEPQQEECCTSTDQDCAGSSLTSESPETIEIQVVIEEVKQKQQEQKMNGLNGHSNGDMNNGCGDIITQNQQKGCWTIGLINSKYRYLTAETFGFKINANGASLKKKQVWTLEPESSNNGDSLIYLRSHLDKYLAVDSFGNVTCESDVKDPGSKFQISVSEDGSGRWALKNVVRGYFLGSTSDKLTCTAKVPGDAEFWHIHLAARPQVNLRSVGRKRFAHLSENLDEIHVDANIPWGEDTLFTLEFRLDESGKYAIHTCNNKYLSLGGKLVDQCNKDCLFSAEYHSGQLALRDRNGAYLSPIGSKAVLKTRSNTVTKDELFSLEDSLPQASFVASLNSRFVSVKQGVDVTANQDEISDHETFQLEFDWSTKRWYIRTMQDRYWTLETGGGIQACGDKRSSNALFDLVWQNDGSLAFRANNGRYIITKRSGHLYATSDAIDDNCKYFFYLINRPILVLKCEQGFVGYKSASSPKLECNKATYECIQVERGEKGVVYFKGQNGKYWHVDSEGVTADSDVQEGFYLELREPTRLCIKSLNGNYLTASKNGLFRLGDTNIENATQWEY